MEKNKLWVILAVGVTSLIAGIIIGEMLLGWGIGVCLVVLLDLYDIYEIKEKEKDGGKK